MTRFYSAMAQGQTVGKAMLAGQGELMANTYRIPIIGAGELHMQDWFVPILYQEQHDPQLFGLIPSEMAQRMLAQQNRSLLGELPATPEHTFIGHSRELLHIERLLEQQPFVVIRGQGGAGKTTLAVELARWLVRSRRFDRCAFVSVEQYSHARAVLDTLGKQLAGNHYSVAEYGDNLDKALQPITRTLENDATLQVLDNMESLLADGNNIKPVLELFEKLNVGWGEERTPTTPSHVGVPDVTPTYNCYKPSSPANATLRWRKMKVCIINMQPNSNCCWNN